MKILYCFLILLLCTLALEAQQTSPVLHGKILSASTRQPVEGAIISLQHTKKTSISKSDGSFTISLASTTDTLFITHVSYQPQSLAVTAATSGIVISLHESVTQMNDVVVNTGYQTIPKERATGSFVKVSKELLDRRVAPDIISKLEGITSGLVFFKGVPNRPQEINIRGQSTLFSNSQPLIVVDNFPYEGDINTINPNDVESITVLKDAAAASIWGVRAGNGVIVVTTRKGSYNNPLQVSANSSITIGERADLFYDRNAISPADFIDVESLLFGKGFYDADLSARDMRAISPVVDILNREKTGTISPEQAAGQINALKNIDIRNGLEKYFYRKSVSTQHSINLQGGSDKASYLFSAGYDNDLASQVGNSSNRITVHSFDKFRPLKHLEISAGIDFVISRSVTDNTLSQFSIGRGASVYPYAALADAQENPLPITKDYNALFAAGAEANGFLNWQFFPLKELQGHFNNNTIKSFETRLLTGLTYNLLKGVDAEVKFQYEKEQGSGKQLATGQSYYARNLVNKFSIVSPSGTFLNYVLSPGGILDESNTDLTSLNIRGQLSYNKSWGLNTITGIAGAEARQISTGNTSVRLNSYNDDLATFMKVDPTNYYPTYPSGNYAQISADQNISSTLDRYTSFFANAAYTYNSRYTFSGSGRVDGSNYFGVAANKKHVPLWSVGFKWDVDKEAFYKSKWLSLLRPRITYGYNGNLNKLITALPTGFYINGAAYTNLPLLTLNNPPNKNLQWEKTAIVNVAIDFALKNNTLSGSIEYYEKRGNDIIGDKAVAPSTGFINQNFFTNTIRGNYATIQGHGWDVQLYSKNIDKSLQWSTQLLVSHATDKTTFYGGTNPAGQLIYYGDGSNGFVIPNQGKPVFAVYSLKWAGLNPQTGAARGYVADTISEDYGILDNPASLADIEYNGSARPLYYGSLGNTFSWRHLTLFVNITFKMDYYFRRQSINYYNLFRYNIANIDYTRRWQKTGDEKHTEVPALIYPANSNSDEFYNYSSVLVERADHIRLQDISLSYDFNKNIWHRHPVNHVQFYGYINNVGLLWRANKQGIDPDYPGGIPAVRTYALGLRINL